MSDNYVVVFVLYMYDIINFYTIGFDSVGKEPLVVHQDSWSLLFKILLNKNETKSRTLNSILSVIFSPIVSYSDCLILYFLRFFYYMLRNA